MTIENLLGKGYFPRELPPPFQTEIFARLISQIDLDWQSVVTAKNAATEPEKSQFKKKYLDSKWMKFSIPKHGLHRRNLALPNPYHQWHLSKVILQDWTGIQSVYGLSAMSYSKPTIDPSGKRALKMSHNFGEFKYERVLNSFDKTYQVKTDISRYYSTIYTHSIPWAIHTKPVAKARRNDHSLLGNKLDKNVRIGNSSQTIGIPIGPDTSLILSELIGCALDQLFQTEFVNTSLVAFRYIDDYYVYCENQVDAEQVIKFLQQTFGDFQLEMNEEKTKISKIPYPLETVWAIELGSFSFEAKTSKAQQTKIERFVSLAFIHAAAYANEHVIAYAIGILKNLPLFDDSWVLYEALILKMALTEPTILSVVSQILVSHKTKVNVNKIATIISNILATHLVKGHQYEVSWVLWLCKEFEIPLKVGWANAVFATEDVASILLALDLRALGLIDAVADTTLLEAELTIDSLMEEKWLLTYESLFKRWLASPPTNPIYENEYFDILRNRGVYFYDQDRKLDPFKVIRAEDEIERLKLKSIPLNVEQDLVTLTNGIGYDSGVQLPPVPTTEMGGYEG